MSNDTQRETRPFSIRLTSAEKEALLHKAGRLPLGTYIRNILLCDDAKASRRRQVSPVKDHEALARVLGTLGQSRIPNNLNQLAKAVNLGTLPVTSDTELEIAAACTAVTEIRADLIRALGLQGADLR